MKNFMFLFNFNKINKLWCFFVVTFTLLLCISMQSAASQVQILKIGSREQVIPFADPQAYKLVEEAAKKIGLQIRYEYYPAGRSIGLADKGILDGEIYRHQAIESDYSNLIQVAEPVAQLEFWVWVPNQNACIANKTELSNYKPIGINSVFFYKKYVYPLSRVGFEEVKRPAQLFGMLAHGRADYTVNDFKIMSYQNTFLKSKLKPCLDKPLFKEYVYLYLHRSNSDLVKKFEVALKQLKEY